MPAIYMHTYIMFYTILFFNYQIISVPKCKRLKMNNTGTYYRYAICQSIDNTS